MLAYHPPIGDLIREWRQRRRMSQLDLALEAQISARHLSFVETNRSRPSRDMIVNLCQSLELPLRERNRLLLAAGFAPLYSESPLASSEMAHVREAIALVLKAQEPYPAVVLDRYWNMIDGNAAIGVFTSGVDPKLLSPPVNVLRATLHPDGLAARIVNFAEWRAHLLGSLKEAIAATHDEHLRALYDEFIQYSYDGRSLDARFESPSIVVPLRLRAGEQELSFFSTIATFGTPMDLTVAELMIESFFPADDATASYLAGNRPASQRLTE